MRNIRENPLVSCIMPTRDRPTFVSQAVRYFLRQDYAHRELIIVDDSSDPVKDLIPDDSRIRYINPGYRITIGAKRNMACAMAAGTVIVHWDDDDWMADWRIRCQVEYLLKRRADICGLHTVYYYDSSTNEAWQHIFPQRRGSPWVAGGTLCYTKAFWQKNPFLNINVGEDTRFLWSKQPKRVIALPDPTFYVALIHPGNTCPKRPTEEWYPVPIAEIRHMMREDWDFYASRLHLTHAEQHHKSETISSAKNSFNRPLVSCVMATYNRRHFFPRAVQYFVRQDYPNRELIIVDDGTDLVRDLVPGDRRIRYYSLPTKYSIGVKRNLSCAAAQGEILIFWDDDDWYGPNRISYQVAPLLSGQADMTALDKSLVFHLPTRQFWACSTELHERMFLYGVVGGTLAFRKRLWTQGKRFPDYSVAEEAAFIREAVRNGARLRRLANQEVFVYVRHDANTWKFQTGSYLDRSGWRQVEPPPFMPKEDLEFYGLNGR